MKRILKITTLLILAVSLIGLPSSRAQLVFFFQNPLMDEEAPDFTGETVSGKNLSLSKYRDGKNAIIFFWATWCPSCRKELTKLNEESDSIKEKDIKVVLIGVEDTKKNIAAYFEKHKIGFESFLDNDYKLSEQYGVSGVPTLFFVDKEGVVKQVEHELPEDYYKIFVEEESAAGMI